MNYLWLKYHCIHSKMASFDPRECMKRKEECAVAKLPLSRFEPTLGTSLRIVIPMNLQRLSKHKANIEMHMEEQKWKDLNMEQINASRTVQQLKATIRELDQIKEQIQVSDLVSFEKRVLPLKEQSQNAILEFAALESLIRRKVQSSFTGSACALEQSVEEDVASSGFRQDHVRDSVLLQSQAQVSSEELAACESWDLLRDDLIELNNLVQDFASIVHQQQEMVDNIESNISSAQESVSSGAKHLAKASKYKAAIVPLTGAVVGGLIGGPIGLIAGFKLAGVATAIGGVVIGYKGAKLIKEKHDAKVELELRELSKNKESLPHARNKQE